MAGFLMVVTGMKVALVDDRQPFRRKSLVQLLFHRFLYGHRRFLSPHVLRPPQKASIGRAGSQISG
jgi:hypothetical protein